MTIKMTAKLEALADEATKLLTNVNGLITDLRLLIQKEAAKGR